MLAADARASHLPCDLVPPLGTESPKLSDELAHRPWQVTETIWTPVSLTLEPTTGMYQFGFTFKWSIRYMWKRANTTVELGELPKSNVHLTTKLNKQMRMLPAPRRPSPFLQWQPRCGLWRRRAVLLPLVTVFKWNLPWLDCTSLYTLSFQTWKFSASFSVSFSARKKKHKFCALDEIYYLICAKYFPLWGK